MKDISNKRLFRWFLASFIIMVIYAYSFGVGIASAETGTITVEDETSKLAYTFGSTATGTGKYDTFAFDTANYNSVSSFWITTNTAFFKLTSNYSYFTCSSGCTGNGFVSYNKNGTIINWDFASGFLVTSSPFVLNYETNIFDSTNFDLGTVYYGIDVTDSNKPMAMTSTTGATLRALGGGGGWLISNNADVSVLTSEIYTVQYPFTGKYQITIDKTGIIATKNFFTDETTIQYQETTFNDDDFASSLIDYGNGLYINLTLSTGAYTLTLINATGSSIPTATPTPTINSLTGSGILWDKDNYSLNEIGTLQYLTSSSFWDWGSNYRIEIYKNNPETLVKKFENVGISGNVKYQFGNVGSYTAKFIKWQIFDTLLDSASVTVSQTDSYIFLPSTVATGQLINTTYRFGVNAFETEYQDCFVYIAINKILSDGTLQHVFDVPLDSLSNETNTDYYQNITISDAGDYTIQLKSGCYGVLASINTKAVYSFIKPETNISTSYINTTRTVYSIGDIVSGSYGIDNNNRSGNYIDVYNNDNSIVTATYIVTNQFDTFNHEIFTDTNLAFSFENTVLGSFWIPGSNTIRLHSRTGTTDTVIASKDITVSSVNTEGYGFSVDKTTLCPNDYLTITVTSPTLSTLTIDKFFVVSNNVTYTINTTTKTIRQKFISSGDYQIILNDDNGYLQQSKIITVSNECVVPTTTTTKNVFGKVDNNNTWIFLIYLFFILIGYFLASEMGVIGGFGIGTIVNWSLEYLETWMILFMFLIVALAVGFMFSFKGGGK